MINIAANELPRPASMTAPVDRVRDLIEIIPAMSDELLDAAFRLRFQVYCVERGFIDAAHFPDGRERDADDPRSRHSLLLYRPTETVLGTVRLILPLAGLELPVSRAIGRCWSDLDLPVATTAEVSRFAIAKQLRKELQGRPPELGTTLDLGARRTLPLLSLGLIKAVAMMGRSGGVTHIVAMMEPALLRLLARLGVEFHAIGEPIDHRGWRQPGWAALSDLVDRFRRCLPELQGFVADCGF